MKLLIIRFSSIGDIVLTTPVIRCVKRQLKNAELHYITKRQFADVLSANTYIDKIHTLKGNLIDIIQELRKENFDFVIDLHHNQRSFLLKKGLQAKSKSFDKQNIQKWMMVNFKVNKLRPVHIVDRYTETVKDLGVENDGKGLDYFVPQSEEIDLKILSESHRSKYIGWVIGAVHNTKKIPIHKIISACKKIKQPVVLLGGKAEYNDGEEILKSCGEKIFNACGKFSLNQSASLVRQSSAIITNDTGLMHIAAAFQKPIISLWGNTIPEFGMYPYYGNTKNHAEILEVKNLKCRPCSKLGYTRCPKSHFKCMEMIDENRIVQLLDGLHL